MDYCIDQANQFGWICCIIWGEKGGGKSGTLLKHGYAIFHGFDETVEIGRDEKNQPITRGVVRDWTDEDAWEKTLQMTIFRPKDFAKLLTIVLHERTRLTWVGWDDINIHFPRSMYSTNRKIWENFAKNWEGFRANLSIFECTAPRKDKVVSFILDDMNWDILVSNRQKVEATRWFWDKDYYEPGRVNKFRLDIDDDPVNIQDIPRDVWSAYWERKIQVMDESTEGFQKMLEDLDSPKLKVLKEFNCPKCQRDMGNQYNLKMHIPKCGGPEITIR